MFSKTSLIVALTAAAAPQLAALAASVPSQSFKYSEVVVQADVSTPLTLSAPCRGPGRKRQRHRTGPVVTTADREFVSGAIANIQSLFLGDVFHMAGTSHHVSSVANEDCVIVDEPSIIFPAFYHEIRTTIDAAKTTIYSLFVAPEASDIGFDRELLASLEITDVNGNVVDISDPAGRPGRRPQRRPADDRTGPRHLQHLHRRGQRCPLGRRRVPASQHRGCRSHPQRGSGRPAGPGCPDQASPQAGVSLRSSDQVQQ